MRLVNLSVLYSHRSNILLTGNNIMTINKKSLILSLITVLLSVLIVVAVVNAASDLIPPGSPNPAVGTMKTLEDIYQRLVAGTAAGSHTLSPSAGPAGTMHTLTDIYGVIPTNDQVCSGTNAGIATCGGTPALVWQDDPAISLCWSAGAYELANGCSAGVGLLDPETDGAPLLGAIEYCQYLKQDASGLNCSGTPTVCTAVDYWHLPTQGELLKGLSEQFIETPPTVGGFQDSTGYWSGSEDGESYAWIAYSYGSVGYSYADKVSSYAVRCAH